MHSLALGEVVVKSKSLGRLVIQRDGTFDFDDTNSLLAVMIVLKHFKTYKTKIPFDSETIVFSPFHSITSMYT